MWRPRSNNSSGFTLLEMLIALAIMAFVTLAAFEFYKMAHQQVLTQQEISDLQLSNRNCLEEIATNLRKGGYLLDGHPPYGISGDSLFVYFSDTKPVDTILYYLEELSDTDYKQLMMGHVDGMPVYKLYKKVNSESAVVFADDVTLLQFTVINAQLIAITLETQAMAVDNTFPTNNGFRTFINTERVVLRNVS